MDKEAYFIRQFSFDKAIGDDGAILGNMCVSQDAFMEDVHFRRGWLSPYEIGRKAMLVNLSDAVAMNAKPRYALLSVALPPDMTKKQMRELAEGLYETAKTFGVRIVGGDTVAGQKLEISVTVLADCPRPLRRDGIKIGDWLAYTGSPGRAAKALRRLFGGSGVSPRSRFVHPVLRGAFVYRAARHLRAGMDLSDGLFHDLSRLAGRNRLGFRFLKPLPKSMACAGEDYEMLVAVSPRRKRALARIARATRTPLTFFAKAGRYAFVNPCRPHHR